MRSPALSIPWTDNQAQEWLGYTLKSTPTSNVQTCRGCQEISARPSPTSAPVLERRFRASEILAPLTARAAANHRERWPWRAELAHSESGLCGTVPRGYTFEHYIHDPVEPRRSGLYEFCIVGIDSSKAGEPRYYAWEPTGHFDRWFARAEVEKRLSLESYGRNVALTLRPTRSVAEAHAKEGKAGLSAVVRWPDRGSTDGMVHGKFLPEVDDRGLPRLTFGSRFQPRTSADLLSPLLHRWRRDFASALDARQTGGGDPGPPRRLLVLDGTGRAAARLAFDDDDLEVRAIDDLFRPSRQVLKFLRDRRFPVQEGTVAAKKSAISFEDGAFDVVLVPFAFHRLCGGVEEAYLELLREAVRVAKGGFLLIAEDLVSGQLGGAAAGRKEHGFPGRWRHFLSAVVRVKVLLEGDLRGGLVADHFLSKSGVEDCSRKYLVVEACPREPIPSEVRIACS
eukprot:TRINITY_DN45129_c0_g1_i1.p1 TRINITY_DN45129_c0_g1~~TRINITY_DN45129_c0_g1_i1.p1  ORF type:complete len:453 (+),score=78.13 TRINITY_DN45129_c0_g1_i1:103-1461(+)